MKSTYLLAIVACLALISVGVYYSLGGFDPIAVAESEGGERTVIGRVYVGRHKNPQLDSLRQSMVADIKSGKLQGTLTVIDYQHPSRDSVSLFVGVSDDSGKGVVTPLGYEHKTFKTPKVYRIAIGQSAIVRPTPQQVAEEVTAKAKEAGLLLQPYAFELYYEDGSLSVEYWVKD